MKRRTFLKSALATAAATPFFLEGMPVRATTPLKYLAQLPQANLNDRILIICQLFGGNDGLNTIIPVDQDTYYNIRPNIAIPKDKTKIYAGINFAPNLIGGDKRGLVGLLEQGSLAVVQGIGYPNPNLSHFRSTDIWLSGINNSDVDARLDTGWVGRYLEKQYPDFPASLPDDPLAIQFGGFSLALQSSKGRMGIEVTNPQKQAGVSSSADALDDESTGTSYLNEYNFVADIASRSNKYAQRVKDAYAAGKPQLSGHYASDSFASQMANCAALIAGGLNTKVYVVSLGGFDNHVSQLLPGGDFNQGTHPTLLNNLADGIAQFMYDMVKLNLADRVIGLTVSEFGRRPYENGSLGTDHGTSSIQFVFGTQVLSGAQGYIPDLAHLDENQDIVFNIDYHRVYLEVLTKWFDLSLDDARLLLPDPKNYTGPLDPLPIIQTQKNYVNYTPSPARLSIGGNYPNPFANKTTISIEMPQAGMVTLSVSSIDGKYNKQLFDRKLEAGFQRIPLDLDLASGNYLLVAKSAGMTASKMVQCVK
ncbi:MAG: DUF1501 domain-containing protein [Bacteroidota bacterium]|nr:DUF1501 domain-containing protein [Bacteroidota bacterium]MDP4230061.1 DUF1501 domain-containing protein [Bacteroidota bacterium]MDP4237523.1 DUF1501 domain-containing protein [Bacteroidota bacterium]